MGFRVGRGNLFSGIQLPKRGTDFNTCPATTASDRAWLACGLATRSWVLLSPSYHDVAASPIPSRMKLFLLAILLLGACAQPLREQRRLAALHTKAAVRCKAQPATCARLAPCSEATRRAMAGWQEVLVARSKRDATGEAMLSATVAVTQVEAEAACSEVSR